MWAFVNSHTKKYIEKCNLAIDKRHCIVYNNDCQEGQEVQMKIKVTKRTTVTKTTTIEITPQPEHKKSPAEPKPQPSNPNTVIIVNHN